MVSLTDRIEARDFTMAVLGIGRVGLPLAISFATEGVLVYGVDRDASHVETIRSAVMPFMEEGAGPVLARVLQAGQFVPTTDAPTALGEADVIVLTVGTPLAEGMQPDHSQIEEALEAVISSMRRGVLLVLRSTVAPGTTQRVVVPALEAAGRHVGRDVFVAFCPERIAEGKAMQELRTLPEIIGGWDSESGELAAALFRVLGGTKKTHLTDPLSAELAKLYTNVYRYVNFALANEYALIAEHYERDAGEIIGLLRDDYPRAPVPSPGPAGGPCLSKDGYFLIQEITYPDFVLTAWKLNESIPLHMVQRLRQRLLLLGREIGGTKIAVLGRAFKAEIDDERLSPSLKIVEALKRLGAVVLSHDPYIGSESLESVLEGAEAVILATNHAVYGQLDPKEVSKLVASDCVVVDCWGMLEQAEWEAAGFELIAFGRG